MALPATTEAPVTLDTLLDRLEEITPLIEKHRDAAEENGRLSDPVVEALKEAGFLRLYVPRSYGGLEIDPITFFYLTERISRLDASVGWLIANGNALAYITSHLSEAGTDAIFGSDPNATVCGSLNSMGKAIAENGGYRFSSQAPFNTGSSFSDWCLMQGQVDRDDGPSDAEPEMIALLCPMKDAEIIDNWDVIGMCATASNDVRVKDALVPESLTFPLETLGEPRQNPHFQGDLYRMPVSHNVPFALLPVLDALRAALDWVSDLAQNKTPIFTSAKLRHRSISQINYAKALGRYRASHALLEASLRSVWEKVRAGQAVTSEDKAEFFLAAAQANEMITDGIRLAALVAGTSWIRKGNPLERAMRDIEVMHQHAYMNESRFGTVSQVHWGLEPDFGFISI